MKSWRDIDITPLKKTELHPRLSLFNSKSGLKQAITEKSTYMMYVCGITPYDATHLGHAATYLTFDLIHRYLRAQGAVVEYVQNITDIDDPLLERALRDGLDWQDLAHSQIDLFRGDMQDLRVLPPQNYIGAVEAIPLVVNAIEELQRRGAIYTIERDLYFENSRESDFGALSHLEQSEMEKIFAERGGDPTLPGKVNTLDCLVWMAKREGEPGWPSSLGTGRPGWHIECTAIALEYLHPQSADAELIDIQGGGSDLIFPHHEMCRSQAMILTGKELASHYVHAGMIGLDGEKMSKSKGNLVLVSELVKRGVDPMAIRLALMFDHYRSDRMWSHDLLVRAEVTLSRLREALSRESVFSTQETITQILLALADDLNTPLVISLLENWIDQTLNGASGGDSDELKDCLDSLLGLKL